MVGEGFDEAQHHGGGQSGDPGQQPDNDYRTEEVDIGPGCSPEDGREAARGGGGQYGHRSPTMRDAKRPEEEAGNMVTARI
ncbi:hypothetical protein MSHO_18870 [Mycobacterium shottsii]|uniref:Uncharacterized protein n=1 Tax=Mycobacterium shottsii TaxID=133549 RepID=A0A7I7LAL5_9MYCO|nr:hypothetical protein MSHO_18870 [Mycobacterium shottsii]